MSLNSDKELESCLSSPFGIIIIKKCVEEHNKTSEAAECLMTFLSVSGFVISNETKKVCPFLYLQSKSTSANQSSCLCQSMFDSLLSLYSTSQLFCTKTFLDDLVDDHRDARFWTDALLGVFNGFEQAKDLAKDLVKGSGNALVDRFTELWNENKNPSFLPKFDIEPIPYGTVEMRRYPSAYFACTEAEDAIDRTKEVEMSTKLFAYIDGENNQNQKLGMTAPFLTKMSVKKDTDFNVWVNKEMCYYIPEKFQVNPPWPNNPELFIMKKAEMVVFVKMFKGDGSALKDSSWILEKETFATKMANMDMTNEVEDDHFYMASYEWWFEHEVMLEKKQLNPFNMNFF